MTADTEIIRLWIGAIAMMAAIASLIALVLQIRYDRQRWTYLRPKKVMSSLRDADLDEDRGDRLFAPLSDAFTAFGQRLMRPTMLANTQALLDKSGRHRFLTARRHIAISWALVPVGLFLGSAMAAGQSGDLRLLLGLFVGLVLSRLPNLWLKKKAAARSAQITRELPDVLDQITISVGAGLGLDAAMTRVAARTRGALGSELTRTMQDIRIGVDRSRALRNLVERTGSEDLDSLVSALLQGLEMGMPLSPILEARAHELRRKRRAAAEEKAHKLSVKMAFPTAVCILPALLLVVIGPAVLQMAGSGFSG